MNSSDLLRIGADGLRKTFLDQIALAMGCVAMGHHGLECKKGRPCILLLPGIRGGPNPDIEWLVDGLCHEEIHHLLKRWIGLRDENLDPFRTRLLSAKFPLDVLGLMHPDLDDRP